MAEIYNRLLGKGKTKPEKQEKKEKKTGKTVAAVKLSLQARGLQVDREEFLKNEKKSDKKKKKKKDKKKEKLKEKKRKKDKKRAKKEAEKTSGGRSGRGVSIYERFKKGFVGPEGVKSEDEDEDEKALQKEKKKEEMEARLAKKGGIRFLRITQDGGRRVLVDQRQTVSYERENQSRTNPVFRDAFISLLTSDFLRELPIRIEVYSGFPRKYIAGRRVEDKFLGMCVIPSLSQKYKKTNKNDVWLPLLNDKYGTQLENAYKKNWRALDSEFLQIADGERNVKNLMKHMKRYIESEGIYHSIAERKRLRERRRQKIKDEIEAAQRKVTGRMHITLGYENTKQSAVLDYVERGIRPEIVESKRVGSEVEKGEQTDLTFREYLASVDVGFSADQLERAAEALKDSISSRNLQRMRYAMRALMTVIHPLILDRLLEEDTEAKKQASDMKNGYLQARGVIPEEVEEVTSSNVLISIRLESVAGIPVNKHRASKTRSRAPSHLVRRPSGLSRRLSRLQSLQGTSSATASGSMDGEEDNNVKIIAPRFYVSCSVKKESKSQMSKSLGDSRSAIGVISKTEENGEEWGATWNSYVWYTSVTVGNQVRLELREITIDGQSERSYHECPAIALFESSKHTLPLSDGGTITVSVRVHNGLKRGWVKHLFEDARNSHLLFEDFVRSTSLRVTGILLPPTREDLNRLRCTQYTFSIDQDDTCPLTVDPEVPRPIESVINYRFSHSVCKVCMESLMRTGRKDNLVAPAIVGLYIPLLRIDRGMPIAIKIGKIKAGGRISKTIGKYNLDGYDDLKALKRGDLLRLNFPDEEEGAIGGRGGTGWSIGIVDIQTVADMRSDAEKMYQFGMRDIPEEFAKAMKLWLFKGNKIPNKIPTIGNGMKSSVQKGIVKTGDRKESKRSSVVKFDDQKYDGDEDDQIDVKHSDANLLAEIEPRKLGDPRSFNVGSTRGIDLQ
ncbi:hypothetical protein AAMO2058_001485700 [Amorphochlora amoebiformis]